MSAGSWWKDLLTKLVFLYVCVLFLGQFYSIYISFTAFNHTLFPKSLAYYTAFPHFIFAFYWGVAVALFWMFLKNRTFQNRKFWLIPLTLLLFLFGQGILYPILMSVNPYG